SYVKLAVLVEVADGHPPRVVEHHGPDEAGLEGAVAVAEQHGVAAAVGRIARERARHVELAVAIEIADAPPAGIGTRDGEGGRVDPRPERAVAVARQDDGLVRRPGQEEV